MNDYLSVTAVTRYLKHKLDTDGHLQDIYLKGEVSNFKAHSTGHMYFSIKDDGSRMNAIMFKFNASKLKFKLEDGMHVLVHGKISVYEATGNYQIYIDEMLEDGIGNLYIAYEQLKKQLAEEGLFDESHKLAIPKIPSKIGVITAPSGAAVRDIITTLGRRWPLAEIFVFPCLVQGDGAKEDIVARIKQAQNYDLDTLIVGRGGGSIEDLWAFNEEIVARAIFDSKIPIISAVGHEIDTTIADFVSDLRAPTPTAAAELAVPEKREIEAYLKQVRRNTYNNINQILEILNIHLNRLKNSFILKNINTLYEPKIEKLILLVDTATRLINEKVERFNLRNKQLIEKLIILNPLQTLSRGYTITKVKNKVITTVSKLKVGDTIDLEFNDGIVNANILNKEEKHG